MNLQNVTSSNIDAIGYEPLSRTLRVALQNGRSYDYFQVPEGVHRALMTAPSHGQYFSCYVRDVYL